MAERLQERSEISSFDLKKIATPEGLRDFAKVATKAKKAELENWAKKSIPGSTQLNLPGTIARSGVMTNGDYLHARLGIIPLPKEDINSTTIAKLEQLAETGKVKPTLANNPGKKREIIEGTKSLDLTGGVTKEKAVELLKLFPSKDGLPTKEAVNTWNTFRSSDRIALQIAIGTKNDTFLGPRTIMALQAKANDTIYLGDTYFSLEDLKKDVDSEKKAATISTGVDTKIAELQSAGIQVGETSATVPSSETASTMADIKAATSETFVDTPEKQATRKLMEEAEAARTVKLAQNTPAKTVQETTTTPVTVVDSASQTRTAEVQRPVTEVVTTTTQTQSVESSNTFSSLDQKYTAKLAEVANEFNPDKYTYVSFKFETQDKVKVNKVYQIDTNALRAEGIDDITKQNSFMLMHMVSLGGKAIPKYFRDIDTLSNNTIPGNLTGLSRLDYVNTLLKSQGKEIKPNILSDVNGLGVGLKKTLLPFGLDKLVGLGKVGNESVDKDERKSEMKKIQKNIDQKNEKIFEANNKDNLGEHYVQILANAKSMEELVKQSETDPILQDIISTFKLGTPASTDDLGLTNEDPLEKIKLNIAKQGKDHFKKKIGDFINKRSSEGFIVRNTNFLFADATLQSITSKDGSGILKGNMEGGKEIYLSAQRLDLNAVPLSYTENGTSKTLTNKTAESFKGKTIDLGMQQSNASADVQAMMKETKIHIDNNGVTYLVTSPKYISTLSQVMSRTGDALRSDTAKEVYKIVGTVLLTLKLAGDHIGTPNIGTPNLPSIDVSSPDLHTPDISSLNTALGGYALTGLILNRKIALLEGDLRKTTEKPNANGILRSIAKKDGSDILANLDREIVQSNTTEK